MADSIVGNSPGGGTRSEAGITTDSRLLTDTIATTVSNERSLVGKLYGIGTGRLTLNSTNEHSVLWFRNDAIVEDLFVQKIIFGWDGGSTNFNRELFSLIYYNTGVPSANNTAITDQIENISKTGASAVASGLTTAHKFDNSANDGMTSGSDGFAQIPNTLAQGNTSIPIDGEIILGPGNSMEFRVTASEVGKCHVAVVYYFAPSGKGRSGI